MTPLQNSSSKKKKQTVNSFGMFKIDSPEESVDSLDFLKFDSLKQAVKVQAVPQGDWAKDWLGIGASETPQQPGSVDMQPGVAYNPSEAKQQEKPAEAPIEAPMNYQREILNVGKDNKEEQESGQKISMLINELQRLAQSVKAIEKAAILQAIDPAAGQKTGSYYENFFEWMLLVVQDARRKVEDSGVWLNTMSKKKPAFGDKPKTGMKVAQEENNVATQTG